MSEFDISKQEIGVHLGGKHGEVVMCLHCEKPACAVFRRHTRSSIITVFSHRIVFKLGGYAWSSRCRYSEPRYV